MLKRKNRRLSPPEASTNRRGWRIASVFHHVFMRCDNRSQQLPALAPVLQQQEQVKHIHHAVAVQIRELRQIWLRRCVRWHTDHSEADCRR